MTKVKGTLYGTTSEGGIYVPCNETAACGTVFSLNPKTGAETVLHSFGSGSDGYSPFAGLLADSKGDLYGTTEYGGTKHGGTVFKIAPDGTETVLYNFCSQTNCADGLYPIAGLIADSNGNLYGTTFGGPTDNPDCPDPDSGCGIVFKLAPDGTETVLYTFCSQGGDGCTDGANPAAGLIDVKGNLYGTTGGGGGGEVSECATGGCGVAFKLVPDGTETVLHTFCSENDCADGAIPSAGLIRNSNSSFYGTTTAGGSYNGGTVFNLTK